MFVNDYLEECLYDVDCEGALKNGRFSWEQKPASEARPKVWYHWAKHSDDNIDRSNW